jgi:hypothetical protein
MKTGGSGWGARQRRRGFPSGLVGARSGLHGVVARILPMLMERRPERPRVGRVVVAGKPASRPQASPGAALGAFLLESRADEGRGTFCEGAIGGESRRHQWSFRDAPDLHRIGGRFDRRGCFGPVTPA